jgi:hypothetical protein
VNPLPLGHFRPELPQRCGRVVDAAISAEPAARPGITALGQGFRAAGKDII